MIMAGKEETGTGMKAVLRIAVLAGLLTAGLAPAAAEKSSRKKRPDKQIARYAAVLGTNHLAKDNKDAQGLLLLRLAHKLQPVSDTVLLTLAYLERGKNPPLIPAIITEKKFLKIMLGRADFLRQKELPKNTRVGALAMLYYRVAEQFLPESRQILLGIKKLQVQGTAGEMKTLWKGRINLEGIFANPRKPKRTKKWRLEAIDSHIAECAAAICTNRLAANPEDKGGAMFLRLAGRLDPQNDDFLLTIALLERNREPLRVKTKTTEDGFISTIIERAEYLREKIIGRIPKAGRLCLLYYRFAEWFQPDNPKILLGLQKLKLKGITGELDRLLDGQSALGWILEKSASPPRSKIRTRTVPGLDMVLVWIPAGTFKMGSKKGLRHERPVHEVKISRHFWIGRYEVTQSEYTQIMAKNPSFVKGQERPVEWVNWHEAMAFCQKLTRIMHRAGRLLKAYECRLPTEAEWEYCCRAGSTGKYCFGDDPAKLGNYAWYSDNSGKETQAVGRKKPNAWGLYDMHGNVSEWCLDLARKKPNGLVVTDTYKQTGLTDPLCLTGSRWAICRGSSCVTGAKANRSAYRAARLRLTRGIVSGFRVVIAPIMTDKVKKSLPKRPRRGM